MTLSIVIVCHNALDDLARCLESLHHTRGASPLQIDIVVVDNASTEPGLYELAARWPLVQFITLPGNRGFAAGTNVGIRATQGELVLLLNSDTSVGHGALDTLVARLTAHPDAGAAGPRLVDAEGRTEVSFGPMISPFGELRQKVTGALHRAGTPPIAAWVERRAREEHYVDWVSGACLLVWRRDAEAVGLLDERYFLYTEDVDFCAALRARGRRILFAPGAEITHLRGRSRRIAGSAMDRAYRRSQIAFYEKHHPAWAPVLRAYLRLKGVSLS